MREKILKVIKESFPILSVTLVISTFAGVLLNSRFEMLATLPALLALAPPLNDMAGDFGTIIGSRLASALHLGLLRPKFQRNPILERYVVADFITAFVTAIYLSFLMHFICSVVGIETIGIARYLLVCLISGMMMTTVATIFGIVSSFVTFAHGWDPNNTTIPIVTVVGDLTGAFSLILAARILGII